MKIMKDCDNGECQARRWQLAARADDMTKKNAELTTHNEELRIIVHTLRVQLGQALDAILTLTKSYNETVRPSS